MDWLSHLLSHDTCSSQTGIRLGSGEQSHFRWRCCAEGILCLEPKQPVEPSILLSVGIHGNETAPIEILNQHVQRLFEEDLSLAARVMIIFGNLDAMRAGQRYLSVDMNRLFGGRWQQFPDTIESTRAHVIETHVRDFFSQANSKRYHFDLHTAIRGSHQPRFGLIPSFLPLSERDHFFAILMAMDLDALVVNPTITGTFSVFTHQYCQAISCTLELGKAKPFGQNDVSEFRGIDQTLAALLFEKTNTKEGNVSGMLHPQQSIARAASSSSPNCFLVSQELTKHSDAFTFHQVHSDTLNFTAFAQGDVIATDGDITYKVTHEKEWILFPNPSVRVGFRAGLMIHAIGVEGLFV